MKPFVKKILRGFALVWFVLAAMLVVFVSLGFEFYQGGFWHGYNKFTLWFSPFNVYGFIANPITVTPGALVL